MKPIFIFQTFRGFGKGFTLLEAMTAYEKANGKGWKKEGPTLLVFKGEKLEDVSVDMLNYHTANGAEFVCTG